MRECVRATQRRRWDDGRGVPTHVHCRYARYEMLSPGNVALFVDLFVVSECAEQGENVCERVCESNAAWASRGWHVRATHVCPYARYEMLSPGNVALGIC